MLANDTAARSPLLESTHRSVGATCASRRRGQGVRGATTTTRRTASGCTPHRPIAGAAAASPPARDRSGRTGAPRRRPLAAPPLPPTSRSFSSFEFIPRRRPLAAPPLPPPLPCSGTAGTAAALLASAYDASPAPSSNAPPWRRRRRGEGARRRRRRGEGAVRPPRLGDRTPRYSYIPTRAAAPRIRDARAAPSARCGTVPLVDPTASSRAYNMRRRSRDRL